MTNLPPKTAALLADALTAAHARAAKLEADARAERLALEKQIHLARGTRENVPARLSTSLAERLEVILRSPEAPITLIDLAAQTNEPAERVARELRRLRATKCPTRSLEDAAEARAVYNHGTEDLPSWRWVCGDDATTAALAAEVEHMISVRPYTFAELTLATGARRGRLSGVIVALQRAGRAVKNVGGDQRMYRWFLDEGNKRPTVTAKKH